MKIYIILSAEYIEKAYKAQQDARNWVIENIFGRNEYYVNMSDDQRNIEADGFIHIVELE